MNDLKAIEKNEVLEAHIDWVSVTFKDIQFDSIFTDILNIDRELFIHFEKGLNGYDMRYQYASIVVLWSTKRADMGYHLSLNGSACRQLDFYLKAQNRTWKDFFRVCIKHNANFTRLDLCIDDRKTFFELEKLNEKIKNGELVSKFKDAKTERSLSINDVKIEQSINISDATNRGITIYFGSKKSAIFFRFYEKNYEVAKKTNVDVKEIGPWNRYEIQMRDDYSNTCANYLSYVSNIEIIIKQILINYLRFVNKDENNINKSRWKIWKPWADLIGEASKLSLYVKPENKTYEEMEAWLKRQVSTSLKIIREVESQLGYDSNFLLDEIIKTGKLKELHFTRINDYVTRKREEIKEENEEAS